MRRLGVLDGLGDVARAIRSEEVRLDELVTRAGSRRKLLAPLTFVVGALAMLLEGVRLLLVNWRLVLIEVLPAVWVWLAMLDLKLHVFHHKAFNLLHGWLLALAVLLVVALTALAFFMNAVFAFAIAAPGDIRAAYTTARHNSRPALIAGSALGLLLAFAALITPRWGKPWFGLTMSVAVALLMIIYVAVPARIIGVRAGGSRRDRVTASLLSSALGATVCTPPYLLGRAGLLMLGSPFLLVPGVVLLLVGSVLQMGANGAVRAVKLGAALAPPG